MYEVDFRLTGLTPIIMHQDDVDLSDMVRAWRDNHRDIVANGDDRTPGWTWQTCLYTDGTHLAIPVDMLMPNLRWGAVRIKSKTDKKRTLKDASQSGISITTEFLKFTVHGSQIGFWSLAPIVASGDFDVVVPYREEIGRTKQLNIPGFQLFAKRVAIGKAKHIRVRPRFSDWEASGTAVIGSDELGPDELERLFGIAGRGGFGDWRPSTKIAPGIYGQYEAKLSKPRNIG